MTYDNYLNIIWNEDFRTALHEISLQRTNNITKSMIIEENDENKENSS